MDRRTSLKLLLAPLLAGGLALHGNTSPGRRNERILIVGAGVSALGAAEHLREAGFENITILEARDRVGGRVWTSNIWRDVPVDLGASWIHGPRRNPIAEFAREAGARTMRTDWDNERTFTVDGGSLSRDTERSLSRLTRQLYGWAVNAGNHDGATLAEVVARKFGRRQDVSAYDLDYVLNQMIEGSLAADVEELAANAYAFGKELSGGDVLFPGGYMSVFRDRFARLDIRTGQRVTKVQRRGTEIVVETSGQTYVADRVLITLPLGVLKAGEVAFDPLLPTDQMAAINRHGMGCLNKLYLKFDHVFWPHEVEGFSYRGTVPGEWSQWLNLAAYTGKPVLLAFNSGSFGRAIESRTDAALVDQAMNVVRAMMGSQAPDPTDFQITRWHSDPLSRGSYSFIAPGVNRRSIQTMARPVGDRLFFAGEATVPDYPSTVHGAYLSGRREAERILSI
ncbi:MAG: FAD-dependent oxidoreductase [Synoicihabitans sp.]